MDDTIEFAEADLESLALSTHPEFLAIIQQSRREFDEGKVLSFDEMKREVAKMDDQGTIVETT